MLTDKTVGISTKLQRKVSLNLKRVMEKKKLLQRRQQHLRKRRRRRMTVLSNRKSQPIPSSTLVWRTDLKYSKKILVCLLLMLLDVMVKIGLNSLTNKRKST